MKKYLLSIICVLTCVSGAWALDITLTSETQIKNGTFYDGSGNVQTASNWYNKVVTSGSVPFTLDFGANTGVSNYNGKLNVYGNKTLTITSPFKISGYTLTATPSGNCTVTPTGGSEASWTAGLTSLNV